ncbi:MAG TPA: BrxA/BrxB family bacilliredoxin, partial [Longimicrobiales bacterium]|nr:BrxA/BrxB family bacilliredoxin [Longimicrobiales bacterium]
APGRAAAPRLGLRELRTADEVDEALASTGGETVLVAVNSMCGCAAGVLRPALARALQSHARPPRLATVFAGQDQEATARARHYFAPEPPSSPAVALVRDGQLLFMLPRGRIQGRTPEEVAADLVRAFEKEASP